MRDVADSVLYETGDENEKLFAVRSSEDGSVYLVQWWKSSDGTIRTTSIYPKEDQLENLVAYLYDIWWCL